MPGEATSDAATFPREEEPEAGVGPRELERAERMEERRVTARTTERAAAGRGRWTNGEVVRGPATMEKGAAQLDRGE